MPDNKRETGHSFCYPIAIWGSPFFCGKSGRMLKKKKINNIAATNQGAINELSIDFVIKNLISPTTRTTALYSLLHSICFFSSTIVNFQICIHVEGVYTYSSEQWWVGGRAFYIEICRLHCSKATPTKQNIKSTTAVSPDFKKELTQFVDSSIAGAIHLGHVDFSRDVLVCSGSGCHQQFIFH